MTKKSIFDFDNFLIINTAFIGDVALSIYLANEIKLIHPNSIINFLTTPIASELLKPINSIDSILIYNKKDEGKSFTSIKHKANILSNLGINCVINPHQSFRTSLLTYYIKSDYKIGYKSASMSFVYDCKVEYLLYKHSIYRNLELLKAFSEFGDNSNYNKLLFDFQSDEFEYIDNLFLQNNFNNQDKIIAIAPSSVWKAKEWLESNFIELINLIQKNNYKVILIGSENDKTKCENIANKSNSISFAGKLKLDLTLILLSKVKLLISNDSSPVHLAGLVNTPTIEIFGPTSPIFGFSPSSDKFKVIENNELKCRPCNIHGENTCPLSNHECMKSITPNNIFDEITKLI